MIFTKEMIGREIYAIPTGNNARGAGDRVATFKVASVGRVYVGLSQVYVDGTVGHENKYATENGSTQKAINSGYAGNAGYRFFETLDDLADYRHLQELRKSLDEKLRHFRASKLNKSQLERINSILAEVYE